jgi:hypothetical protein
MATMKTRWRRRVFKSELRIGIATGWRWTSTTSMELPCCCRRRPCRRGARVMERIRSRRWRTRAAEVQPQILCNRQIEPDCCVCALLLPSLSSIFHLYLCLSSLQCAASFSSPLAVKPLSLIVSRCRRLSRRHHLLSAGTSPLVRLSFPGWLSRRLSSRRCCCLLSSRQTR